MTQSQRRMFVVNFTGIGNGICVLPMLKRLEEVQAASACFHISNPFFGVAEIKKWYPLKNFCGTVPAAWRRFAPSDWNEIKGFLQTHRIDLVVNLRNEGPSRDLGYFQFKQEMKLSGIEFWELDQTAIAQRSHQRSLVSDQIDLFLSKGVDLRPVDQLWLQDCLRQAGQKRDKSNEIGFFTGASQMVKRWRGAEWIQLGELILDMSDHTLVIYAGDSPDEQDIAEHIHADLRQRFGASRCLLVSNQALWQLCCHMSGLDLLISNDTFSVHLGAALGIPTVGLYFATDSVIWGGTSDRFLGIQSKLGLNCPDFKRDAGNCTAFYGGCPGPCKNEITPQRVFTRVKQIYRFIPKSANVMSQSI